MDEPELYLFDVSGTPDAEAHRAQLQHRRESVRRRYHALVAAALDATEGRAPAAVTTAVLDALFRHERSDGSICGCSCHPRLPDGDLHNAGFDCPCQHSPERRRANFEHWQASIDAYWASAGGLERRARLEAQEAELNVWLGDHPDVVVTTHGGYAPERWEGSVDGRSFSFRERHDLWQVELDLRPSGRWVKVLDTEAPGGYRPRELSEGDVIAEGTTADDGYGSTPAERIRFIVEVIRRHIRRETCQVHRQRVDALERRLGVKVRWCPGCGLQLAGP